MLPGVFIMKRFVILLIVLFSLLCSLYGQNSRDFLYTYPDRIDLANMDTTLVDKNFSPHAVADISAKEWRQYSQIVSLSRKELILSGKVYIGWKEMENYLNKVLYLVLPDSLKGVEALHVFPGRMADLNAFIIGDGTIVFNVGLFQNVTNEASVAIILGHELGHFLMGDNLDNYLKVKTYSKKVDGSARIEKKLNYSFEYAGYSRRQELMADSIGYLLARKAGYDLQYGVDNFLRYQEIINETARKKAPSRITYGVTKYNKVEIQKWLALYPENSERIDFLGQFIDEEPLGSQAGYLVSSLEFNELQVRSAYEVLSVLLETKPRECVKLSFVRHLSDPYNPDYLYYLVESLRRLMVVTPITRNQPFLTEDYLGTAFQKTEGILHDLTYLIQDSVKIAGLPQGELSTQDSIEFETYGEAFRYFGELAKKNNIREAYLSLALSAKDTVQRNLYLEQYLSFDNCWHRDYALALGNNNLYSGMQDNTKDVFIFNQPQYFFYDISDFKKEFPAHENFINEISSIPQFKDYNIAIVHSDDLSTFKFNELQSMNALITGFELQRGSDTSTRFDVNTKTTFVSIDQGVDAFTLSPENWEYANKYDIRSIRSFSAYNFDDYSEYIYYLCDLKSLNSLTDDNIQCRKKASPALYKQFLNQGIKKEKRHKRGFFGKMYLKKTLQFM